MKLAIAQGPKCPHCGGEGFDDWWHDATTRYDGFVIRARLKCHSCGNFFRTRQYPDAVCHSEAA